MAETECQPFLKDIVASFGLFRILAFNAPIHGSANNISLLANTDLFLLETVFREYAHSYMGACLRIYKKMVEEKEIPDKISLLRLPIYENPVIKRMLLHDDCILIHIIYIYIYIYIYIMLYLYNNNNNNKH